MIGGCTSAIGLSELLLQDARNLYQLLDVSWPTTDRGQGVSRLSLDQEVSLVESVPGGGGPILPMVNFYNRRMGSKKGYIKRRARTELLFARDVKTLTTICSAVSDT